MEEQKKEIILEFTPYVKLFYLGMPSLAKHDLETNVKLYDADLKEWLIMTLEEALCLDRVSDPQDDQKESGFACLRQGRISPSNIAVTRDQIQDQSFVRISKQDE